MVLGLTAPRPSRYAHIDDQFALSLMCGFYPRGGRVAAAELRTTTAWETILGPTHGRYTRSFKPFGPRPLWGAEGLRQTSVFLRESPAVFPRGVWIEARTKPYRTLGSGRLSAGRLRIASRALIDTLPELVEVLDRARSAIYTETRPLSFKAAIGYCGEFVYWARHRRPLKLQWSPDWMSPYDLDDESGRRPVRVEVKATLVGKRGTSAKLSWGECVELASCPERRIATVRVANKDVQRLHRLFRVRPRRAGNRAALKDVRRQLRTRYGPALDRLLSAEAGQHSLLGRLNLDPQSVLDAFETLRKNGENRVTAELQPAFPWWNDSTVRDLFGGSGPEVGLSLPFEWLEAQR